jgi:hypothetical protein
MDSAPELASGAALSQTSPVRSIQMLFSELKNPQIKTPFKNKTDFHVQEIR